MAKPTVFLRGRVFYARRVLNGKRRTVCLHTTDKRQAQERAQRLLGDPSYAMVANLYRQHAECARTTVEQNIHALAQLAGGLDKPVSSVSAERVHLWLRRYHGSRHSANSRLRQAKSVFAKALLPYYGLAQPPAWLTVRPLRAAPVQYHLDASTQLLVDRTLAGLSGLQDKSVYWVIVLAAVSGLRTGEIAHCRPEHILADAIVVPADNAKGRRGRIAPLPAVLASRLRQWASGSYILPGTQTERTESVFRRASAWMRSLGWRSHKTIHELRKHLGAKLATEQGIYVAQRILGHASPETTSRYYASLTDYTAAAKVSLAVATKLVPPPGLEPGTN